MVRGRPRCECFLSPFTVRVPSQRAGHSRAAELLKLGWEVDGGSNSVAFGMVMGPTFGAMVFGFEGCVYFRVLTAESVCV